MLTFTTFVLNVLLVNSLFKGGLLWASI